MGQKHYVGMAVVGLAAAGLGGVIGIISLLNAIGATHGPESTTHYTVLAVLALAVAVLGAAMAIYGEHQLHHLPGGPSAWAANEGWRTYGPGQSAGRFQLGSANARRQVHAPAAVAIHALVALGIAIFCVVGTLQTYSDAQRSSYTQAHGVTETAVADNVQNIAQHTRRSGTTYTNEITVTVRHPVVGNGSATVYGQGTTSVQDGDRLTVLVDPRQPSYAEIPGAPYYTSSQWVEFMLFAVVIGAVAAFAWRRAIIMVIRHRRVSAGRPHVAGV